MASKSSTAVRKQATLETLSSEELSSFRDPAEVVQTTERPSLKAYAGIFTLSGSILMFELALTRIFSVVLWSNLAFMIVSTALFGFGLSGAYLALRPIRLRDPLRSISWYCFLSAACMIGSYLVVTHVPFQMWHFDRNPMNYVSLAVWEISLTAPFYFAGLAVANLLSAYPISSGKLYGIDLVGAALGSLLLVWVLPLAGGPGSIVLAAFFSSLTALIFSAKSQHLLHAFALTACIVLFSIIPKAETVLPIHFFQGKRSFNTDLAKGRVLGTRWSTISRVDIADHVPRFGALKRVNLKAVWIDAGTNASIVLPWDGNLRTLEPIHTFTIGAAYYLKNQSPANVLIIGSSGGREVLTALSHGVRHVDAVEMDPSIVYFLNRPDLAEFSGHLFQNERVTLINDEGRAYMKRTPPGTYDVIQFVNNYTPVAMAAGALNLSETYLLTKEAIKEYWEHLTENGVLSLHRGATLRLALTVMDALRDLGIEHPENHILIANGEFDQFQGFFMKKQPWTKEEVQKMQDFLEPIAKNGEKLFFWSPFTHGHSIYTHVITASPHDQKMMYTKLGINLWPPTDDRPFMERLSRLGKRHLRADLPPEFHYREREKWAGLIPRGDFPYFAILAESAVLALLFIGLPLLLSAKGIIRAKGFFGFMGYFAALGFGFIVVEICLMKRYVLFLGHPAYSISTVVIALLASAGLGSLFTSGINKTNTRTVLSIIVPLIAVALLSESWLSPKVFEHCLQLSFAGRVFVAACLLSPLGFLMGMPFALGLRLIDQKHKDDLLRRKITAWAWGINGYMTVIGSVGAIFIAVFAGFHAALLSAAAAYLLGLLAIRRATA